NHRTPAAETCGRARTSGPKPGLFNDSPPRGCRIVRSAFASSLPMSARPPRRSARTSFLGGRALVQQAGEPVACGLLPEAERPLQAELHSLERFAALMASEGWAAHVAAMAFDRIYARERFIFAR